MPLSLLSPFLFGPSPVVEVCIGDKFVFGLVGETIEVPFRVFAESKTLKFLEIAFLESVFDVIVVLVVVIQR